MIDLALAILLLPLGAFVVQIFLGKRLPRGGDWVVIAAMLAAWGLSCVIFVNAVRAGDPAWQVARSWTWFDVGELQISAGVLLDRITALMLIVVTTVASMVFLFSVGYMAGDPRYGRYFAYLSLFAFSMLGLVLSDNVICLYAFWELVGLSSYLLIGFWFERNAPANAGKKAFLTNRIGDLGMFLGILIFFTATRAVSYEGVFGGVAAGQIDGALLTVAGVLLFCGAVGKSAQVPLHVWLPDAMEGPTPVSALIHAATMVAAGVYMVARLFPLFSPSALVVIAYTGAITVGFAATIAITQTDIKRVLAYSTISQLGYMIMALGVGGHNSGLYHLFTHAYFKALLFLGAGSVIHALHTQEIWEMGGLKRKMPVTFWTFFCGTIAISGVPLTSGFFSKDAILADVTAFVMGHPQHLLLAFLGFGAAGVTAFYMFRVLFVTFTGEPRDVGKFEHAHESPWVMAGPLMLLGALAIGSAWGGWFPGFFPTPTLGHAAPVHHAPHSAHTIAMVLSILVAAGGIGLAYLTYFRGTISASAVAARFPGTYRTLHNKYYVDELYGATVIRSVLWLKGALGWFDLAVIDWLVNAAARVTAWYAHLAGRFDLAVVDGAVDGVADGVLNFGERLRGLQTGRIQSYVLGMVLGLVVLVIAVTLI